MPLINQINDFVEQRGISIYRLAKDCNITTDTGYKFKDPYYLPSIRVLEKICDAYKVSPEKLLKVVSDKN